MTVNSLRSFLLYHLLNIIPHRYHTTHHVYVIYNILHLACSSLSFPFPVSAGTASFRAPVLIRKKDKSAICILSHQARQVWLANLCPSPRPPPVEKPTRPRLGPPRVGRRQRMERRPRGCDSRACTKDRPESWTLQGGSLLAAGLSLLSHR